MTTLTTRSLTTTTAIAPRWMFMAAALLAAWMLTFFVQLLNDAIHRGESLRQQQKVEGTLTSPRAQTARVKVTSEKLQMAVQR